METGRLPAIRQPPLVSATIGGSASCLLAAAVEPWLHLSSHWHAPRLVNVGRLQLEGFPENRLRGERCFPSACSRNYRRRQMPKHEAGRDILSQPLRREGTESLSVDAGCGIGKIRTYCLGLTRWFPSGDGERALSGSSGPMPVWRFREPQTRERYRRRERTATSRRIWPLGYQTVASLLGQKGHRVSHLHFEIRQVQGWGVLGRGISTGRRILMLTAPEQD